MQRSRMATAACRLRLASHTGAPATAAVLAQRAATAVQECILSLGSRCCCTRARAAGSSTTLQAQRICTLPHCTMRRLMRIRICTVLQRAARTQRHGQQLVRMLPL